MLRIRLWRILHRLCPQGSPCHGHHHQRCMVGQYAGLQAASQLCFPPCHRDTPRHCTLRQHRNISHHPAVRQNNSADPLVGAGCNRGSYSSSRRHHILCLTRRHHRPYLHLHLPPSPPLPRSEVHHEKIISSHFI